jgi:hypothetical protein
MISPDAGKIIQTKVFNTLTVVKLMAELASVSVDADGTNFLAIERVSANRSNSKDKRRSY